MSPEALTAFCTASWTFASLCWVLSTCVNIVGGSTKMAVASVCILIVNMAVASYYWMRLLAL